LRFPLSRLPWPDDDLPLDDDRSDEPPELPRDELAGASRDGGAD